MSLEMNFSFESVKVNEEGDRNTQYVAQAAATQFTAKFWHQAKAG